MNFKKIADISFKIMTTQWSLTVVTGFVTAEKLC